MAGWRAWQIDRPRYYFTTDKALVSAQLGMGAKLRRHVTEYHAVAALRTDGSGDFKLHAHAGWHGRLSIACHFRYSTHELRAGALGAARRAVSE